LRSPSRSSKTKSATKSSSRSKSSRTTKSSTKSRSSSRRSRGHTNRNAPNDDKNGKFKPIYCGNKNQDVWKIDAHGNKHYAPGPVKPGQRAMRINGTRFGCYQRGITNGLMGSGVKRSSKSRTSSKSKSKTVSRSTEY
jgi:hypothetical protein